MLRTLSVGLCSGLAALFLAGILMSCGGGGGGSTSGYNGAPTYSLSGKVSGAVAQGVTISLSGAGAATTTTNSSGAYSFGGLSNGSYTVTASRASYAFSPASQVVPVNSANAVAPDFVSANAYSISGTVVDVTGVQDVTVSLSGSNLATPLSATTDANGVYLYSGIVTNGTYTVTPSKSQQRCACIDRLNGGCNLTVTESYSFTPASLSITISGADELAGNFTGTLSRWSGACPN